MFGGLRFILAVLVALSHLGVFDHFSGINPGQLAVVSFYTLSGLLMDKQFAKLGRSGFYVDRFFRVYPLYLACALIAWAVLFEATGQRFSSLAFFSNLTVFPLNYRSFYDFHPLIGPAFSLACELHFYLLVPALAVCSLNKLRVILFGSLFIFILSPFLLGLRRHIRRLIHLC
jgi:peptidoglycan/LPS O-acetylase OafA/YrhL